MPNFNVAKAVRSNPIYAMHLRWVRQYSTVLDALGFVLAPNSAVSFAEGVAAWQGRNGLKADGMLGPRTWQRLRLRLRQHKRRCMSPVPIPGWLVSSSVTEGWADAIVATLRQDTNFIRLRHDTYTIEHHDFRIIADLIERGHIRVFTTKHKGASYEFRNAESDANSIDVPARSKGLWRRTQALLIHEACHAISDYRRRHTLAADEESLAYVVQAMFLEHHGVPPFHGYPDLKPLRDAARAIARRQLGGETTNDAEWSRLRDEILQHPVYAKRGRRMLVFDGTPAPTP